MISKPVSRATFVLGKFAGVAAAVTVGYYLAAVAFLMTVRHGVLSMATDVLDWPVIVLGLSALGAAILIALLGNLIFGWTFTAAAIFAAVVLLTAAAGVIAFIGKGWTIVPFGAEIPPRLLPCLLTTFLAVMVFTAVAVAASTRLGQVMTLLVCGAVLMAGYLHRFLFATEAQNPAVRVLGWIVPNLRVFDTQEALVREKSVPLHYVASVAAYAGLYAGGVLALGAALFQRRCAGGAHRVGLAARGGEPAGLDGRTAALALGIWAVVSALAAAQFRTPVALAVRGRGAGGRGGLGAVEPVCARRQMDLLGRWGSWPS